MGKSAVAAFRAGPLRCHAVTTAAAIISLIGGSAAMAHMAYAATSPVSRGVCRVPKNRPKIIVLAVDGSAALSGYSHRGHVGYSPGPRANLRWTTWTSKQARASGYLWVDDGYPSVGGGSFYAVRASIRVWRPIGGVFTRLRIMPHGSAAFHPNRYWRNPKSVTYDAQGCGSKTWSW
jgi:hypothetical protein